MTTTREQMRMEVKIKRPACSICFADEICMCWFLRWLRNYVYYVIYDLSR